MHNTVKIERIIWGIIRFHTSKIESSRKKNFCTKDAYFFAIAHTPPLSIYINNKLENKRNCFLTEMWARARIFFYLTRVFFPSSARIGITCFLLLNRASSHHIELHTLYSLSPTHKHSFNSLWIATELKSKIMLLFATLLCQRVCVSVLTFTHVAMCSSYSNLFTKSYDIIVVLCVCLLPEPLPAPRVFFALFFFFPRYCSIRSVEW